MRRLELLERRREQNRKPSAAEHTCECRECCVQFRFPESPKGCSGTGQDSEVVKKYDKSSRGHEIKPGATKPTGAEVAVIHSERS